MASKSPQRLPGKANMLISAGWGSGWKFFPMFACFAPACLSDGEEGMVESEDATNLGPERHRHRAIQLPTKAHSRSAMAKRVPIEIQYSGLFVTDHFHAAT